jgi:hypothetical protein
MGIGKSQVFPTGTPFASGYKCGGRNIMYADPGDYEDTIDITSNPCKNKDHSQSDGSDWHPSQ